jgi:hypothetical protein
MSDLIENVIVSKSELGLTIPVRAKAIPSVQENFYKYPLA